MDEKLIVVLIGIVSGAIGYWITTFWMKPILQYRELKSKILIDLIFYAQVVNAKGLDQSMKSLYEKRIESNRRHSAELTANFIELPTWYKIWLKLLGYNLEKAAQNLIGYSNTTEYAEALKRVECIKQCLCIKSDVV